MNTNRPLGAFARVPAVRLWREQVLLRLECEELKSGTADNYVWHFVQLLRSLVAALGISEVKVGTEDSFRNGSLSEAEIFTLISSTLRNLTASEVNRYLRQRAADGFELSTIRTTACSLRQAFEWLRNQGVTSLDEKLIVSPTKNEIFGLTVALLDRWLESENIPATLAAACREQFSAYVQFISERLQLQFRTEEETACAVFLMDAKNGNSIPKRLRNTATALLLTRLDELWPSYVSEVKRRSADFDQMRRQLAPLRQFYAWAKTQALVSNISVVEQPLPAHLGTAPREVEVCD